MKFFREAVVAVFLSLFHTCSGALPEIPSDTQGAQLWLSRRMATINASESKPLGERNSQLGEMLRQLKTLHYRECPELEQTITMLQSTLLAITGHARYFAEEIKREQKEVASYPTSTGPRVTYDFHRSKYFETLSHLPSPETIAVLGDFLSDDIDTPRSVISPHSDWGENPRANSYFSSRAIMEIGLRNPPVGDKRGNDDPDARLAETRSWWERIKSGERTFSFKGRKEEYRFKPDGTWETLAMANPPDDGPGRPQAGEADRPLRRQVPELAVTKSQSVRTPWKWIAGTAAVLAVLLVWFLRRVAAGKS